MYKYTVTKKTDADLEGHEDTSCRYCGGDCPNDHDYMCDGYSGDVDNLYADDDEDEVKTILKECNNA